MHLTTTWWLVSGLPHQFIVMCENKPVLDLVPLRGLGRETADGDRQSGLRGQPGKFGFLDGVTVAVGIARIRGD